MSIITLSDLSTYMGGNTLTPTQQTQVTNTIIPGIQEELERYLNTTVELVQVRESLAPECDGYVYFTYAPVRQILSATWSYTGAQPVTITQYVPPTVSVDPSVTRPVIDRTTVAVTDSSYRFNVGFAPAVFLSGPQPYMVFDYIAGYDGKNDKGLKLDLLRVTAREVERQFDTSVGIRSGSLEPAAESDTRQKGWTKEELASLDRLKRRMIL